MPELSSAQGDPQAFSPEARLLILAARLELEPAEAAAMANLLQGELQWPSLLKDAHLLGAQTLLYHHLATPPFAGLVPAQALAELARAYQNGSLKNLRMHGLVLRLFAEFQARGFEVMLLKGGFLGPWLYRDLALRPMSDLDLLIHPQDRQGLWTLLHELGFQDQPGEGTVLPSGLDEAVVLKTSHLPPLFLPKVARLEVHLYLLSEGPPRPVPILEELWAQGMEVAWNGVPVRGLGLEHLVLYLCCHLHKHAVGNDSPTLYWFCDLHEIIRSHGSALDWDRLLATARSLGKEAALAGVLTLLKMHWGTSVPASIPRQGGLDLGVILQTAHLDTTGKTEHRLAFLYWDTLVSLRHAQGPAAKLRNLLALVFPTREKLAFRHQARTPWSLLLWRVLDPFWQFGRISRSLFIHATRRLRH